MRSLFLTACMALLGACVSTPVPSDWVWEESVSTINGFETRYETFMCAVDINSDGTAARFAVTNPYGPGGMVTSSVRMSIVEGEIEVIRSGGNYHHNNKRRTSDLFYDLCFRRAQALPEPVKKFLHIYLMPDYGDGLKIILEEGNIMTHYSVRHSYF